MSELPSIAAAPPRIATDLPCMTCQYNLRTLSPTGRCPECNTPVADSLAYQARLARLDLSALFRGALLLALVPALHTVSHELLRFHFVARRPPILDFLGTFKPPLLEAIALCLGIRWLAAVKMLGRGGQIVRALCLIMASLFLLAEIVWVYEGIFAAGFLYPARASDPGIAFVFDLFRPLTDPFQLELEKLPLFLVAFILLRLIAQRLHRPGLSTLSAWTFLIATASIVLNSLLVGHYLDNLIGPRFWSHSEALYRISAATQFLFWLAVALVARRAGYHTPPHPWGLLTDPAPASVPSPTDPNRFAPFRLWNLRAAVIALPLPMVLPLSWLILDHNADPRILLDDFDFNTAFITLVPVFLGTALLVTYRRHPSKRHLARAVAAALLVDGTIATLVVTLNSPTSRLDDPPLWVPATHILLILGVALLIAARAFFLNFSRETGLTRLTLWTRIVPMAAIALLLPIVFGNWLKETCDPIEPFSFLDQIFLPLTAAALALLTLYAIVLASTILRLPTPPAPKT